MKKIGDVTSTADKNGEWTNGNVAAGIAPTILEAGWLNSVQREILGVLTKAGIPQDKNNDTQLAEAISAIISGGNYATKTEVNSKLAKDENGADIPNKLKFIENLGLPELLDKKADADTFFKINSDTGISGSNGDRLIVGNSDGHTGIYNKSWKWSFNSAGRMINGEIPKDRIPDLPVNTANKSENGWWKCADTGIIYQWGRYDVENTTSLTIPLPISFPNGCIHANLSLDADTSTPSATYLFLKGIGKSSIYALVGGSSKNVIYFFAVGY